MRESLEVQLLQLLGSDDSRGKDGSLVRTIPTTKMSDEDKDGEEGSVASSGGLVSEREHQARVQLQLAHLMVDYARHNGVWKGGRLDDWIGNVERNDELVDLLEQIPDDTESPQLEGIYWTLFSIDGDLRDGAAPADVEDSLDALLELVRGILQGVPDYKKVLL